MKFETVAGSIVCLVLYIITLNLLPQGFFVFVGISAALSLLMYATDRILDLSIFGFFFILAVLCFFGLAALSSCPDDIRNKTIEEQRQLIGVIPQ